MFDASTDPVTDFDTGDTVNVIDTIGYADIIGVKVEFASLLFVRRFSNTNLI